MGVEIRESALQQDVRVVSDDRVDSGGLIAGENDARQDERDNVFTAQKRFAGLASRRCFGVLGSHCFLHFAKFEVGLFLRAGTE